jgi:NitT/TauT family transport system ATP-binding protein
MNLEVRKITKAYDGNCLFNNLDLFIESGEIISLVGRSGLGKSTLLNIMGSFLSADQGKVYLNGEQVTEPDIERIMIFQTFDQLFPWKTVEENILFPIKHSNKAGLDLEVILDKLELTNVRNHYPYQLSGGMKQRVALGRAIITRPGVMLMDEPFGSLDITTRRAMQELIIGIWKEFRITIIFVTHDVNEAIKLGDRILILSDQKLTVIDNPILRPRSDEELKFQDFQREIINLIK